MKSKLLLFITVITLLSFPNVNFGQAPNLGAASSFVLFTATGAFGNTGATFLIGNIGTNVGALTGFPPGTVVGQIHVADAVSAKAATDVATTYSYLTGVTCDSTIGTPLGNNQVLPPHVYCIVTASTLNGNLILDGRGNPNAIFIFKIGGAFATGIHSTVTLINKASLCNVYWQIGGQFTLGDSSVFSGIVIANGPISLLAGSSLIGKGLSCAGAISLNNNTEGYVDTAVTLDKDVPDPGISLYITSSGSLTGTSHTVYIKTNGILSVSGTLNIGSLDINNAASAIINARGTINIASYLTNLGTLILKSDPTGTATLIHSTPGVKGTAERYVATDPILRYHYFSSPVDSASVMTIFDPAYGNTPVYYYDPSLPGNWAYTGSSMIMQPGKGYAVRYKHPTNTSKTISYNGRFNTGNIKVNISNTDQDWNLVGNPYPAPISSSTFISADSGSIYGAIYLWDDDGSGGSGYTSSDYATCTGAGCTVGIPGHKPNGNIASGQGFFVQSKTKDSNSISFTNSMKTTTNTQFFINDFGTTPKVYLNMTDKNANYNEIMFAFSPIATKGFDNLLDGRKLQGNPDLSFYSLIPMDTNGYVIQALPPILADTIKLGFYTGVNGNHTIKLEELENFDYSVTIYLYDKYDSTYTDLRKDSVYNFTSSIGTFNDRLYIVFTKLLPVNAGIIQGNNTICQNQKDVVFSVYPIANADEYEWSYDGNGVQLSPNDNILYMNISDSATSGTLMVRGKNNAGYGDYSYLNLTIQPLPGKADSITGPNVVCSGSKEVEFKSSNIANATSYIWTLPDSSTYISFISLTYLDFNNTMKSGYISLAGTNPCGNGKLSYLFVNILPKPITPTITLHNDTLTSSSASGNQWYENDKPLPNETKQNLTQFTPGRYYVMISKDACLSDTSNTIDVSANSIYSGDPFIYKFDVYPDPTRDNITIDYESKINQPLNIELYETNGRLAREVIIQNGINNLKTDDLIKGVYTLKAYNKYYFRIIKIIKE